MKRILFLLVILLFTIGCSGEVNKKEIFLSDELEEFISTFNAEVENLDDYEEDLPELEKIKKENVGQLKEEIKGYNQSLLKVKFGRDEGYYEIFALYNHNKKYTGFRISTKGPSTNEDVYVSIDDRGLMLGAVLADSIGLEIEKYYNNFKSLLREQKETGSYNESDYEVSFTISPKERTVIVDFSKRESLINSKDETPEKAETEIEESLIEGIEGLEEKDDIEYDESQDNIDDIDFDVNYVVDTDLDNTDITGIEINEDASVDEERYIVLVDLKWDVKNKPKTTKDMLDMYSDHLAAKLADNELIHELVFFWEVPYHKEGESILKRTYQNKEDGMYLEDEVKETSIFK